MRRLLSAIALAVALAMGTAPATAFAAATSVSASRSVSTTASRVSSMSTSISQTTSTVSTTQPSGTTVSEQDRMWFDDAVRGARGEVMLGQLAETKAVTAFGQLLARHLMVDHSRALVLLTEVGTSLGLDIPSGILPGQVDELATLRPLSGPAFDRQLAEFVIPDHQKDIGAYQQEVIAGSNQRLRALAGSQLPVLALHLTLGQLTRLESELA